MSSNNNNNPVSNNKRSHKHLNYIPWEPTRAAVSRVEQTKYVRPIPEQAISTQLYRYQNSNKSPSPLPTTMAGKDMGNTGNKVKPTATVEPFQASINVDEIFYGTRSSSPTNPSLQDLNLSSDQQELKNELERTQEENAGLKQQLEIQTQVLIF